MNKLWYVIFALAALIILMILFDKDPDPVDIMPFEIQIAEQNLIIDSLTKSNRATFKRIQEDSIIQAEERAVFKSQINGLKSSLSKQRVVIDTVIRDNPEVARYVELADSTIQVQGERIETLESNLSGLRVDMSLMKANFEGIIQAQATQLQAEREISKEYRKQARKATRGSRLWKAATVTVGLLGLFGGSQL